MASKEIDDIEGIGAVFPRPRTTCWRRDVRPKGRRELAARTEIAEKHILRWVNMADLFRIEGVGSAAKRLTRQVPSSRMVDQWVNAAKTLPAGVDH